MPGRCVILQDKRFHSEILRGVFFPFVKSDLPTGNIRYVTPARMVKTRSPRSKVDDFLLHLKLGNTLAQPDNLFSKNEKESQKYRQKNPRF